MSFRILSSDIAGFWRKFYEQPPRSLPRATKQTYSLTFYILMQVFSHGGLKAGVVMIQFNDTAYTPFWHKLIIYTALLGKTPPFFPLCWFIVWFVVCFYIPS